MKGLYAGCEFVIDSENTQFLVDTSVSTTIDKSIIVDIASLFFTLSVILPSIIVAG